MKETRERAKGLSGNKDKHTGFKALLPTLSDKPPLTCPLLPMFSVETQGMTCGICTQMSAGQRAVAGAQRNYGRNGRAHLLCLRVYVPAYRNPRQVPLPDVTVTLDGASRQLPTCPASTTLNSQGISPGEIIPVALGSAAVGTTPDTNTRYAAA
jgi:hypothetical protein